MTSIQVFNSYSETIHIHIDKQLHTLTVPPKSLSSSLKLESNIYHLQINNNTDKIYYEGKLLLLENQQLLIFPLPSNQCISVLKNTIVPENESTIQFLNLSQSTYPLHLSVTVGDNLFENISYKQISEPLAIFPMIIDLEIRETEKIIKSTNHFKPNHSYIIVLSNEYVIYTLDLINFT